MYQLFRRTISYVRCMSSSLCFVSATIQCCLRTIIYVLRQWSSPYHHASPRTFRCNAEYEQRAGFLRVDVLLRCPPRLLSNLEN
ncbi:hypothetical protein PBCV1_a266R [Paramecium bursaria Chlorella virus 1]|uniref:Uncharacterized protein n=1 Tax=Paramecium bursaria Chlorella virus 1 TaxID=10506 RepID=Q84583_PBCV1|nr:hypothetical protein PBCV1_a266R [Paramecium bursaria Chlorella virus 1]AAC96634.1 hypothetical protein [Paramecium bursaria Chlorella virus 1]